jgi:hypothetical protein
MTMPNKQRQLASLIKAGDFPDPTGRRIWRKSAVHKGKVQAPTARKPEKPMAENVGRAVNFIVFQK